MHCSEPASPKTGEKERETRERSEERERERLSEDRARGSANNHSQSETEGDRVEKGGHQRGKREAEKKTDTAAALNRKEDRARKRGRCRGR